MRRDRAAELSALPALPELPGPGDDIVGLFARTLYGRTPAGGRLTGFVEPRRPETVLGGAAVRRRLVASIACPRGALEIDALLHVPAGADAAAPAPVVVALNFTGNADTIDGGQADRWPYAQIVAAGFAVLTADYREIEPDEPAHPDDPDQPGNPDQHDEPDPAPGTVGVRVLFPEAPDHGDPGWGAIGAWAWGLSRLLDLAALVDGVDAARATALGHSRLGKAALWAAAQDERFAAVVSNDSGCAGASLFRHPGGEDIAAITRVFPHWLVPSFAEFAGRESELPFDQHQLLAAVAPRRVLVLSARDDHWADPVGEELAALAAAPAFAPGAIEYHARDGGHDLTPSDWARALAFSSPRRD